MIRNVLAVLSLLYLTGCAGAGNWPPNARDVADSLRADVDRLARLADQMRADGIERLHKSETFESQVVAPARLTPDERDRYRPLFDGLGLWVGMVEVERGSAYFRVDRIPSTPDYDRFELRTGSRETDRPACESRFRRKPCGFCAVETHPEWELSYFWIDDEVVGLAFDDETKLEYEERERRHARAIQACFSDFRALISPAR